MTITRQEIEKIREQAEQAAYDFMWGDGERIYFYLMRELKQAIALYNSTTNNSQKLELLRVKTVYTPSSEYLNDGAYVYKILPEQLNNFAQDIINEWNNKDETDQYVLLRKCVKKAAKDHGLTWLFNKYEMTEIISDAWIALQRKLNDSYINKANGKLLIKGGEGVSLGFIVYCAACDATSTTYQRTVRNRMKDERHISLDKYRNDADNSNFYDILPDRSPGTEQQVIGKITIEEALKKYSGTDKIIMYGTINDYSQKEIGRITHKKEAAISRRLQTMRRKANLQRAGLVAAL